MKIKDVSGFSLRRVSMSDISMPAFETESMKTNWYSETFSGIRSVMKRLGCEALSRSIFSLRV